MNVIWPKNKNMAWSGKIELSMKLSKQQQVGVAKSVRSVQGSTRHRIVSFLSFSRKLRSANLDSGKFTINSRKMEPPPVGSKNVIVFVNSRKYLPRHFKSVHMEERPFECSHVPWFPLFKEF